MMKTKVAFLVGQLLISQSEQFKKYSKAEMDEKKPALQKNHFCFGHVNSLIM